MTSDQRLAANRQNAQKSTGPRTDAGKAKSRQNSLKHGLTGEGTVLPDEDATELEAKLAHFVATAQPTNLYEHEFLHRMAIASVRLERSQLAEEGRRRQRRRRVERRFENMNTRRAEELARGFWANAAVGKEALEATSAGCRWLIEHLEAIERPLACGGIWTEQQCVQAIALFGVDHRLASSKHELAKTLRLAYLSMSLSWTPEDADRLLAVTSTHLEGEARVAAIKRHLWDKTAARAMVLDMISKEVARLEELAQSLAETIEAEDLEERLDAAEVDTTADGMRFARYEAMNETALHRNWSAFLRIRNMGEAKLGLVPDAERAQNEAIEGEASHCTEDIYASCRECATTTGEAPEGAFDAAREPREGVSEPTSDAGPVSEPPATPPEGV